MYNTPEAMHYVMRDARGSLEVALCSYSVGAGITRVVMGVEGRPASVAGGSGDELSDSQDTVGIVGSQSREGAEDAAQAIGYQKERHHLPCTVLLIAITYYFLSDCLSVFSYAFTLWLR